MKIQSIIATFLAGSALSAVASWENPNCLDQEESNNLIKAYLNTFQGIPSGGSLEAVEAIAQQTFAPDIKIYSDSLLWIRGYKGPVRIQNPCF